MAKSFFSRDEKIFLVLMAATQFNHIVDFVIMMPLGQVIMRTLSITPQQFSLLVASYTLSAAVSGVLASFFVDRFDRKACLMFFYSGFVAGTLACSFATSFEFLLFARSLAGFFGGVIGSLIFAMASDYFPFERRGTALGVIMGSFSLASVVGVPLSLMLANRYDWRAPFGVLGFLSLIVLALIYFRLPAMRGHLAARVAGMAHATPVQVIRRILTSPAQRIALIFMFCLTLGQFAIIPFISPSLVSNAGMPEADLPYLYLFGGICSFGASYAFGRLSDLFGKPVVFMWSCFYSMIPIYLITNMAPHAEWILLMITSSFFIAMSGRMVPAVAMTSAATSPAERGSFMSFSQATQNLAAALAAMLSGAIVVKAENGYLERYALVGYFSIAFTIVAVLLSRRLILPPAPTPDADGGGGGLRLSAGAGAGAVGDVAAAETEGAHF